MNTNLSKWLLLLLLATTTLWWGCAASTPLALALPNPAAIITATQRHFVPDRRVARLDVESTLMKNGQWQLRGETTLPAAKDSLLRALTQAGYAIQDSISILPHAALGDATWALSRHAVANLRSERGHSQELATQVLLGTPLRLLKQVEEWYMVQCPDGYIAWLHSGELTPMNTEQMEQWKRNPRVIFTDDSGKSYAAPDTDSRQVGDLVKGGILTYIGETGVFTMVRYPDGRQAYIPRGQLLPLTAWIAKHPYSFENTYQFATDQLGKPYLWGGTSPKGMDCSGFTKTVYWQQGLIIPRDASQQVHAGQPVEYDTDLVGLQPGDLLFFGSYRADGSEKITHVGIYLGDGAFIHSGSDNGANAIQNLLLGTPEYAPHRRQQLLRARRLLPNTPGVQALAEHKWYW